MVTDDSKLALLAEIERLEQLKVDVNKKIDTLQAKIEIQKLRRNEINRKLLELKKDA